MAANLHFLFPSLPPELRNMIYTYLSTPDNTSLATTFGLPFQIKIYEGKHTTTRIQPIHYGSNGLLALRKYDVQEANEYYTWLLHNAVDLRIEVQFTGRVNTFVQRDWDKKMTVCLCKLARQHPWLTKTQNYDIQILWASTDCMLQGKKQKRATGQIPLDMLNTLTGMMGERVKTQRGNVQASLCLDHTIALRNTLSPVKFGLATFLSPAQSVNAFKNLAMSVYTSPIKEVRLMTPNTQTMDAIHAIPAREKPTVVAQHTTWGFAHTAYLVMRKTHASNDAVDIVTHKEPLSDEYPGNAFLFRELLMECLGQR